MKDEIKEILDYPQILMLSYGNYISLDDYVKLKNYITNLQEKIEYNDLVLKALHRYFTEHECYETHEFLRQLETCTKNDMVWLKRMAGVNNE